jgi:DNA modification methylase
VVQEIVGLMVVRRLVKIFEEKEVCYGYKTDSEAVKNRDKKGDIGLNKVKIRKNTHPTVKPIKLMTYLTKLITPPNGIVLDPFMGSGSTGMACAMEGFDFVGIDMDEDYVAISEARIEWARSQKK